MRNTPESNTKGRALTSRVSHSKEQSSSVIRLQKAITESPFRFNENGIKPYFGPAVGSVPCSSSVSNTIRG